MLTLIGLNKVKDKVVRLGQANDPEVTAILQAAVVQLNRLKAKRFPS